MSLFLQMKNIKGKVEFLLKKNPHLRDNDNKLIATYWWHELGKEKCDMISGMDFLHTLSRGTLTNTISIVRVRRKLQEQYPELQGESYIERAKAESDIRKNISDL